MTSYSTNPFTNNVSNTNRPNTSDNISTVTAQVEEVKLQMQKNVQLVLDRGENLDNLERRTERLEESGSVFKNRSTQAKSLFKFKNTKWTIFLIIFVVLLIVLIGLAIYLNVRN